MFYDCRGRRAKANVNYISDSDVQVIDQSSKKRPLNSVKKKKKPDLNVKGDTECRRSPRKHQSSEYEITIFGNNTLTL